MSSEVVIRLHGVGKSYPVFIRPQQRLLHMLFPRRHDNDHFHALRNIDLEIRRGEAIGIIGRNGSGKSTLLQIIAGILQPSTGKLHVAARVAALLELGAGFNPEFTGRENIKLNASLLGLSAQQIASRMDRIIAFAEIGHHVEQQIKTYSSGMFMRLAFAVAVHTDPDVLIIDEALSVGDVYFQRKCFKRIEEMRQRGCTLLFVTHAIDSVIQLCDRGIVLDGGRLAFDGDAQSAIKEYLRLVFGDNSTQEPVDGEAPEGADAEAPEYESSELERFMAGGAVDQFAQRAGYNRDETRIGEGGATTCDYLISSALGYGPVVAAREPFRVYVRYHLPMAMDRLVFGVRVCTVTGLVVYSSNTLVAEGRLFSGEAGTVVIGEFDLRCSLLRGQYFLTVGVSRYADDGASIQALDRRADSVILNVIGERSHAEGVADLQAAFAISARAGSVRATQ